MNLASKSAIATAALGGVGLTGAYAGGLFDKSTTPQQTTIVKTTFKKILEAEGFTILDTSQNNQDWNTVLVEYKKATERSFTGSKQANKLENELRSDCEKALVQNYEENGNYRENVNYKRAIQWCVKKETMNKVLENGKMRILKFDATSNETAEQGLLQKKLNKLSEENNKGFNALKKAVNPTITTSDANSIETLKKGCEALQINTLETINDKFLDNFYLAKEFCYVDK
ncbi:hypothetical protein A6V39_00620 [Candidatus Mycoplasma haematobovis]|uniref:Uncharacterized protein n=1 Tax=Candidatus Mycoplasma haematobovis TaxID=432608 RepID=A0A1A9QEJ3_9MOLU|nr:hypothetical protein [Candidatus Mycoplasma haematobovis]OAL10554.1 hypothetical protein A6V39_00620 [Candidatus Mycoplasma haematobovis]